MLPRLTFIHKSTYDKISFWFKRRKFTICLASAKTINKSKERTFKQVGVYLNKPIYTYGQLFVALLRVPNFFFLNVLTLLINKIQGLMTNSVNKNAHCTYNVVNTKVLNRPLISGRIFVCLLLILNLFC